MAMTEPRLTLHPATAPKRLPPNGKHFFIWTIGCQMNEADSAKVAAMLLEAGYRPTEQEDDADIIVLNSCVVRQAAEDKVSGKLNYLARLKREKPEMPLVLTGCMVTNQQEKLRERFPHVVRGVTTDRREAMAGTGPRQIVPPAIAPVSPRAGS